MAKHGENIHKRKDGRWEGRYIKARTAGRKAVWGYLYGATYAEVKERLIQKKAECGFYRLSAGELTFGELAAQWLGVHRVRRQGIDPVALSLYAPSVSYAGAGRCEGAVVHRAASGTEDVVGDRAAGPQPSAAGGGVRRGMSWDAAPHL